MKKKTKAEEKKRYADEEKLAKMSVDELKKVMKAYDTDREAFLTESKEIKAQIEESRVDIQTLKEKKQEIVDVIKYKKLEIDKLKEDREKIKDKYANLKRLDRTTKRLIEGLICYKAQVFTGSDE